MADTGHGATLTNLGGWSAPFVSFQPVKSSIPALPTTALGTTTYQTVIRGDVQEIAALEGSILYDPDDPPPISVLAQEWVLTFPCPAGQSMGATITGSGFLVQVDHPELLTNTLMIRRFQLRWDGVTGPAYWDSLGTYNVEFSVEFA